MENAFCKKSISMEELHRLKAGSYQLIDIRSAEDISRGAIPGAVCARQGEILDNPQVDPKKKLVICCARGLYSLDEAEALQEKGIDAVSLEGGYPAWVLDLIRSRESAAAAGTSAGASDNGQTAALGKSADTPDGVHGAAERISAGISGRERAEVTGTAEGNSSETSAKERETAAGTSAGTSYGEQAAAPASISGRKKKKQELDFAGQVEESLRKKFRKTIWCKFTKAINTYELVKPGDKIAVCMSGGKDSMLMAKLFQELTRHNKFPFELVFLVMDPGYSPANRQIIEANARSMNIPITIFESNIFDSVYHVEKSPCYLCARMRRGYLYSHAKALGCNKIALGHHYDDVIETILMSMLYSAQIQTMMPKLHSTNFEGMELIRPMYLIREDDIKAWRDYHGLHFLQCACKFTDTCTTCANEENLSKRVETKEWIARMKKTNPYLEGNIFKSVENVNIDNVVAYKQKGTKHHFLDTYDHFE